MARVFDNKQYGDQTSINRLVSQASGMKQGAADATPIARTPVGRPQGSGGPQTPQMAPQVPQNAGNAVQSNIPIEHMQLMEDAGRAARVAQIGSRFASDPMVGPALRMYAEMAQAEAEQKGRAVRDLTPNFPVA